MVTTQQLEIDIKAKSDKATASLDALISKLYQVNSALNGLNTNKLNEISAGVKGAKNVRINPGTVSGANTSSVISQNKKAKSSFEQLLGAVTGCNRGFRGFGGTMANLAAKWGMFYAAMYPAIRLFKFFGKEVENSMDYVETFNYFKVTMNKIGHDAGEEFTNSFISELTELNRKMSGFKLGKNGELEDSNMKNLGVDPNVMMQFQAQIGAVTNSIGLLGKTSVNTQKALSMLALDYSSLKNEDLSSVMKNLNSGLIGQSRALYRYGIDITNATLKQYALEHGITKSVSAMSQSEKMQLRLLAILDQSKVAWGDQANSINTVANQYRIMKQQVSNLGRVIGNLFLPIVKTVLPYLNAFIIAMRKIFELLGTKIYGGSWKKDIMEGVSQGNFDGMVEGAEDTEDALDGATKAAKKFKQATMGFDELNIISPETSSSGSGSGIGGGFDLSDDIEDALSDYEKVWDEAFKNMNNKAEALANKFVSFVKAHDYFGLGRWISDAFAEGLESIPWSKLQKEADKTGKSLADLMNGLMSPRVSRDIGMTIAEGINTGLHFLDSWALEFQWDEFGSNLALSLDSFIEHWDAGLTAKTFSAFAKGTLKAMTSALRTAMNVNTFSDFGQKCVDFICSLDWGGLTWNMADFTLALYDAMVDFPASFWSGVLDRILDKIFGDDTTIRKKIDDELKRIKFKDNLKDAITLIMGVVNPTLWIRFALKDSNGDTILSNVQTAWKKVTDWFVGEADRFATEDVQAIYNAEKWQSEHPKEGMQISWQKVLVWWQNEAVVNFYENYVKPAFSKEKWSEMADGMHKGIKSVFDKVETSWKESVVGQWYEKTVKPLFVDKNWTFDGIKSGLIASFEAAINGIKALWNSFADYLNEKLKLKIDPVVIGGQTIFEGAEINLGKLPKFDIPKYAIGGFPEDGLFMANHNELVGQFSNGQTAVANNQQIVEGIKSGVAAAVTQTLAPYLRDIAANTGNTASNTDAIARKPVQSITDRGIAKANIRGQRSLGLQLRTT